MNSNRGFINAAALRASFTEAAVLSVPTSKEREGTSHQTCLHRLDKREVLMATLVVGTEQSMCWRITFGKLLIKSSAPSIFLSSVIFVCSIIIRAQLLYLGFLTTKSISNGVPTIGVLKYILLFFL